MGKSSIGVFLDLSKAFDTINHTILLTKLRHYGIRGLPLKLFKNYLSNRNQCVVFKESISTLEIVKCGVPQGSILGPVLFLLYINDCPKSSNILKFIMFADDTNVFHSDINITILETIINRELSNLSLWFKSNKLSLNINKTYFMFFGHKGITANLRIHIDGLNIERVSNTKFLGLQIDEKLNWKEHIRLLSIKISRSIGIIYRLRQSVPLTILRKLYFAIILPYLQYCNILWGTNYWTSIRSLFLLQKKAIRLVTNSAYLAHTAPLFKQLNTLTLTDLVSMQIGIFMFNYVNKLLPPVFTQFIKVNPATHRQTTRSSSNLYIEPYRLNIKKFSLIITGPTFWNSLNKDTKESKSANIFKRKLKIQFTARY